MNEPETIEVIQAVAGEPLSEGKRLFAFEIGKRDDGTFTAGWDNEPDVCYGDQEMVIKNALMALFHTCREWGFENELKNALAWCIVALERKSDPFPEEFEPC